MSAIANLRAKKFGGGEFTAAEELILDAYYKAKDANDEKQIELAETAANELVDMQERIAEQRGIIVDMEATIRTLLDAQEGGES